MGRVEPGGEPCAEVDQRGRISPDRPLDRGSAALSARDKSADMPASYGGSYEEQGFGCRPSPCGKYRLRRVCSIMPEGPAKDIQSSQGYVFIEGEPKEIDWNGVISHNLIGSVVGPGRGFPFSPIQLTLSELQAVFGRETSILI